MGYRLEISKVQHVGCGYKLFGYTDEDELLESYKWLVKKKFIEDGQYWGYGFNPKIILNKEEFKTFINLYLVDMRNYYPEFQLMHLFELAETDGSKLLEWY